MKTITLHHVLSTGLDQRLLQASTIDIEDTPLGQGGFGVAYRALRIDGRPGPPQVIKLLTGDPAVARRGFDTIKELQQRLSAANRTLLGRFNRDLTSVYPALLGVPQLSFEGHLDGRAVLGYAAHDLTRLGFEELGSILDDDAKTRAFQALPLSSKMRMAAQLVTAFDFLSSEIRFIHADMKAEALFVDVKGLRCAVIDFDSGALARDASDAPSTFGTRQDWLAPEIVRQLDMSGNTNRIVQVNLLSDVWSINIAIHYLLFGFHPLFFMTEISDRSVAAYFRRFQWPDADPGFPFFRREYAAVHAQYVAMLRQRFPLDVLQRFAFTINKGFLDPTARTTYGQWKTVLRSVNQPAIRHFTADRVFVDDTRPVHLSWDVTGAARVDLRGIGDVTHRTSIDVVVRRDTTFDLIVTADAGAPIVKQIHIKVDQRPPTIHSFTASSVLLTGPSPAQLHWSVTGAEKIEIDHGFADVSGRSSVDVLPRVDTTYTLRATSAFGVVAVATVAICVSTAPPRIISFRSASPYLTDGEPARLSWEVSDDAHTILISHVGTVSHRGTLPVQQVTSTTYVLTATTYFGHTATAQLTVLVSQAPPEICEFRATPLAVREGGSAEVQWRVRGAARAWIEPGIGAVPVTGSQAIRPGDQTTYALHAESAYGVHTTRSVTVSVLRATRLVTRTTDLATATPLPTRITALGAASLRSAPRGGLK